MNSGRPIIVVKGSMRIADCVVGLFELKMKDVNKATLPQSGSVSPRARRDELRVQQKCLIAEYHGGEFKGLDEEKKLGKYTQALVVAGLAWLFCLVHEMDRIIVCIHAYVIHRTTTHMFPCERSTHRNCRVLPAICV